jgi:hypothetical protein
MFGVFSYSIEIHFTGYGEDDEPLYNAALGLFLDDGESSDDEADPDQRQHITIFTDLFSHDPKALAWVALNSMNMDVFGNRLNGIHLFEEDNVVIEYDVKEIMAMSAPEDNSNTVH